MHSATAALELPPSQARPQRSLTRIVFNGFDIVMLAISMIVICSSTYWKVQGPTILLGFVTLCIVHTTIGYVSNRIVYKSRSLALFSVVGACYIILSYLRWLVGEPKFFLQEYILRMGYFVLVIYPISSSFYLLFRKTIAANYVRRLAIIGIISSICASIAAYIFPSYDGHWNIEGTEADLFSTIYLTLNYNIANVSILFFWSALFILKDTKYVKFLVPIFMLTSDSAQFIVLGAMSTFILLYRHPTKIAKPLGFLVIFGFLGSAVLLYMFGSQIGLDPNTSHRATWWIEALKAVINNGGLGLGFGADSTTDFIVEDRFQMLGKWGNLPIHVIHNDFVYSIYATGFVGGAIFLIFHLIHLPPKSKVEREYDRHAVIMYVSACLTMSANSALVSPVLLVGICWIYGYLAALRDSTSVLHGMK